METNSNISSNDRNLAIKTALAEEFELCKKLEGCALFCFYKPESESNMHKDAAVDAFVIYGAVVINGMYNNGEVFTVFEITNNEGIHRKREKQFYREDVIKLLNGEIVYDYYHEAEYRLIPNPWGKQEQESEDE